MALADRFPNMAGVPPSDEQHFREHLAKLCKLGNAEQVAALLDSVPWHAEPDQATTELDAERSTGLHLAAQGGHLLLVKELISRKVDVQARDVKQRTALHVAASEGYPEVALELLVAGAEVDAADMQRQTPLFKAVLASNAEVLRVLVEYGRADPTIGDSTNTTPLLLAAERGLTDEIGCLLKADSGLVTAANECGWTALHMAAHGRQMKLVKQPYLSNIHSKFGTAVAMLLEAKADLEAHDEDRKTPLHRAACTGNVETVKLLVAAGANTAADCICRWTPLHYACQEGHLDVARHLLQAKAAVQREEPVCLTPLAVATMENQVKIAELLVSHKADPNLRAKGLASPIMIARKDSAKHSDILSLFELGFIHHAD